MKILPAVLMLYVAGCASAAPATEPAAAPAAAAQASPDAPQETMVAAGFGTLRQEEMTVSIRSDQLLVKVTPLAEPLIRLLAPDTYNRLHAIAESRRTGLEPGLRDPELFLVSFFSYQPDVTYRAEDLQLSYQGRLLDPDRILPLTAGWGRQQLAQQETQSAVYVFEGPMDYRQQITVRYGMNSSDDWSDIARRLETERGKVRSRAGSRNP